MFEYLYNYFIELYNVLVLFLNDIPEESQKLLDLYGGI